MQNSRRTTRPVRVGRVTIGGGAPVTVQGMTKVPTHQADRCLAQIVQLAAAGCELVRVATPAREDTEALKSIIPDAPVPIIADVHFHYQRALEAIEAGVAKIRLNPGNIQDRRQVERVIAACRDRGVAIRIGVNEGSVAPRGQKSQGDSDGEKDIVKIMADSLGDYIGIFEDNHFDQLVLSAKCHDAARTIAVNRVIAERFNYPLHLGVTHAGLPETGAIQSAVALGTLLAEGIGDTIRVSLAGDSVKETEVAWEILQSLGLRRRPGARLIVCPTCGRTQIDLLAMAEEVKQALAGVNQSVTVAVMGCVVNGPGEAADADVALCGGGKDKVAIYRSGRQVAVVPVGRAVESLIEHVNIFLQNSGE
jgi:(E)-4-hydroxy-3-methylbut-2-enyl-diphosphate synthase